MQIFSSKFLVSYDVASLFTNIPLHIATNIIFNNNPNVNITKKELKKSLSFCYFTDSFFFFNGKFYNQIDGVAMDSPLALVLAIIFTGFCESKWLNECNLNKPNFFI